MTPVEPFSTTTSKRAEPPTPAARSSSIRRPSSVLALMPRPRFDRDDEANDGDISPPSTTRMKSG